MKPAIERIELSMEELERLLERARVEPLPEEDYQKLKSSGGHAGVLNRVGRRQRHHHPASTATAVAS
jgi:hypothetical protein